VLTVQEWQSRDGRFDFHLVETRERPALKPPLGGTAAAALPPDPTAPNPDTPDAEQATS
jgi:hypothetical protein